MKELESLVYRELSKTPDGGSHVAEAVRAALQREEGHIKWKLEGCPSLKRQPVSLFKTGPPSRHSRLVKKGQLDLGNPDLTRSRPSHLVHHTSSPCHCHDYQEDGNAKTIKRMQNC